MLAPELVLGDEEEPWAGGAFGVTDGPSCAVTEGAGAPEAPSLRRVRESTEAALRPAGHRRRLRFSSQPGSMMITLHDEIPVND